MRGNVTPEKMERFSFKHLPGAELVLEGLADLAAGRESEYSLLLLMARQRLAGCGFVLPEPLPEVPGIISHALYEILCERYGPEAYSRYNSLVRRIVSFARALERESRSHPV